MPVIITAESPLGIELAKWEQPGYDPRQHPYPKMLYKAKKRQGALCVGDPYDEAFSASCQHTVKSEAEKRKANDEGWRDSPTEALQHAEALEKAISDAAAHRAFEDRNMSEPAKAEAAAADAETADHVAEVPAKRRARRN